MSGVLKCADCGGERDRPAYSYCNPCHRLRMKKYRERRRYADMSPEQRRKDSTRAYANVYKRRGKIPKQPCAKCGSEQSQMHHHDYGRPLDVEWLCRPCHVAWHKHCLSVVKAAFRQWAVPREAIDAEAA